VVVVAVVMLMIKIDNSDKRVFYSLKQMLMPGPIWETRLTQIWIQLKEKPL